MPGVAGVDRGHRVCLRVQFWSREQELVGTPIQFADGVRAQGWWATTEPGGAAMPGVAGVDRGHRVCLRVQFWSREQDRTAHDLHLLLPDPYSFPSNLLIEHLNTDLPGTTVVGGVVSGGRRRGDTRLFRRTAHDLHLLLPDPYSFPSNLLIEHLNTDLPGTTARTSSAMDGSRAVRAPGLARSSYPLSSRATDAEESVHAPPAGVQPRRAPAARTSSAMDGSRAVRAPGLARSSYPLSSRATDAEQCCHWSRPMFLARTPRRSRLVKRSTDEMWAQDIVAMEGYAGACGGRPSQVQCCHWSRPMFLARTPRRSRLVKRSTDEMWAQDIHDPGPLRSWRQLGMGRRHRRRHRHQRQVDHHTERVTGRGAGAMIGGLVAHDPGPLRSWRQLGMGRRHRRRHRHQRQVDHHTDHAYRGPVPWGLVLSWWGSRGRGAHLGVLEELEAAGVTVDRFAGTSMGAIHAYRGPVPWGLVLSWWGSRGRGAHLGVLEELEARAQVAGTATAGGAAVATGAAGTTIAEQPPTVASGPTGAAGCGVAADPAPSPSCRHRHGRRRRRRHRSRRHHHCRTTTHRCLTTLVPAGPVAMAATGRRWGRWRRWRQRRRQRAWRERRARHHLHQRW